MKCPACGNDCIKPAEEVLARIEQIYSACPFCAPEPSLDKTAPAGDLPERIGRCRSCGKAPLDAVMLDALRRLQEAGLRDADATLRSVGTPLIEVGYPLAYPPRLGPKSLILSGAGYSRQAAAALVEEVPEIKGVILSRGVPGVVKPGKRPVENILLAGCDMRADVCQSLFGELVIYKSQSRIHIEFSRKSAPKMKILEQLYLQGRIRDVVDGLCGPGTLGLMCALAGAKRVVLNDAWPAAVSNAALNLEVNRGLLGIEDIEYPQELKESVSEEPRLVACAHGPCEIKVYHGDLERLFSRARPGELCLIDHFPGESTAKLEKACRCCKDIVVI
ncbi:MAG TPA: methyltransferase [Methanothrix sp.]|nr:methyltransferase [Methanothrix sp.]